VRPPDTCPLTLCARVTREFLRSQWFEQAARVHREAGTRDALNEGMKLAQLTRVPRAISSGAGFRGTEAQRSRPAR